MHGKFRLQVLKFKGNKQFRVARSLHQRISQVELRLEGIFLRLDLARSDAVSQRARPRVHAGGGEILVPEKGMRAAADGMPAIDRALILQPVNIVTHYRGVILPAVRGRAGVAIAIEEAGPLAIRATARETDRLSAM